MTDDTRDDISAALHRAAELLPDRPDRLAGVRRKRATRVRRRFTAATATVLVLGGGIAFGVTRGGGSGHVTRLADAQELTATGRVVQVPGKPARACADVGESLVLIMPRPAPQWCALGVDVRGVDLSTLQGRREQDGAVEGFATLTGHLDGDVLVVTRQEAPRDEAPASFRIAPCPAPAGGWRDYGSETNPDVSAAQAYAAAHPDLVAEVAISRPSKTAAVPYLLTWGDPEPVREALRSDYGEQMCLQRSRWTKEEVAAAVAELTPEFARSQGIYTYGSGHSLDDDGQLKVDARAVRETPELDAFVGRHPAGLVQISYWLHPVS